MAPIDSKTGWLSFFFSVSLLLFGFSPSIHAQSTSVPDFDIPDLICSGVEVEFVNQSTVAVGDTVTYHWIFEGAVEEVSTIPFATWFNSQENEVFQVSLLMVNKNSDTLKVSKNVFVHLTPVPDFDLPEPCGGEEVVITNKTSTYLGDSLTYHWDIPSATRDSTGKYHWEKTPFTRIETVGLLAISKNGCKDSTEKPAVVHGLPNSNFLWYYSGDVIRAEALVKTHTFYSWKIANALPFSEPEISFQWLPLDSVHAIEISLTTRNDFCWNTISQLVEPPKLSTDDLDPVYLEIHPNPTTGLIRIISPSTIKRIEAFQMNGQLLMGLDHIDTKDYELSFEGVQGVIVLNIWLEGAGLVQKRVVKL